MDVIFPYEKGFAMVSYLKHLVGDEAAFDAWLAKYADVFAFQSIIAEQMFALFLKAFPEHQDALDIETWLHGPGLPPWMPDLSAADGLTKDVDTLVRKWDLAMTGEDKKELMSAKLLTHGALLVLRKFTSYQVFYLLDELLNQKSIHRDMMIRLGDAYKFTESTNAEIRFRYTKLLIRHNCKDHWGGIKAFLLSQGHQKYTLAVYHELVRDHGDAPWWRYHVIQVWKEGQSLLHPQVRNKVEGILFKAGLLDDYSSSALTN